MTEKAKELGGLSTSDIAKREYFAAMSMQGLRASQLVERIDDKGKMIWQPEKIAEQAVRDADALLEELAKADPK